MPPPSPDANLRLLSSSCHVCCPTLSLRVSLLVRSNTAWVGLVRFRCTGAASPRWPRPMMGLLSDLVPIGGFNKATAASTRDAKLVVGRSAGCAKGTRGHDEQRVLRRNACLVGRCRTCCFRPPLALRGRYGLGFCRGAQLPRRGLARTSYSTVISMSCPEVRTDGQAPG